MADEHDDEHDHEHGLIHFQGTSVTDAALAQVQATHAPLAAVLDLTRRWADLSEEERKPAAKLQEAVETHDGWAPGFHAEGDKCATCGLATPALFVDRMEEGELAYGAFLKGLPVHASAKCLDGFAARRTDTSPRGIDKARRELMRDLDRPMPRMTQFFRHDLLAHPPFGLEDWGNSVAEAQTSALGKPAMKDIERLLRYVHQQLFHEHH